MKLGKYATRALTADGVPLTEPAGLDDDQSPESAALRGVYTAAGLLTLAENHLDATARSTAGHLADALEAIASGEPGVLHHTIGFADAPAGVAEVNAYRAWLSSAIATYTQVRDAQVRALAATASLDADSAEHYSGGLAVYAALCGSYIADVEPEVRAFDGGAMTEAVNADREARVNA